MKTTQRKKKLRRGFSAMDPAKAREICRSGGLTISRNRRHMAAIGRIGGKNSHSGDSKRRRARGKAS